jgi:hypothetical protein
MATLKQGQFRPVNVIILFMIFIIIWFLWMGKFVGDTGHTAVATSHMVGVEAFFLENLNIVIMFAIPIGIVGYLYFMRG